MLSSGTAFAQDVVMRRPLPSTSSQATTTPTPTPGTPTPTPAQNCDSPGNCTPTPTGGTPTPTPPDYFTDYSWNVGSWSGNATCGQSSTMTRPVTCTAYTYDLNSNGPPTEAPADDSECVSNYGAKPMTSYQATTLGCNAHYVQTGYSDWTLDNPEYYGGTAECSSGASRQILYSCETDDGTIVDDTICSEGIKDGGTPIDPPSDYQTGNFSGCTYSWIEQDQDLGCHQDGGYSEGYSYYGDGPIHYIQRRYHCERADGLIMDDDQEAACDIGQKPLDKGPEQQGTCTEHYGTGTPEPYCDSSGGVVSLTNGYFSEGGEAACVAAGATCCAMRFSSGQDQNGNPTLVTQTIGTKGTVQSEGPTSIGSYHYYNDSDGNSYGIIDSTGGSPFWEYDGN